MLVLWVILTRIRGAAIGGCYSSVVNFTGEINAGTADEFSNHRVEKSERVAWLTLDRPDALNTITMEMIGEVETALGDVAADGDTRVLVVTGAGRASCAGADLKAIASGSGSDGPQEFLVAINRMLAQVRELPIPVIAALNGAAVGGGLELALASDFILATESAKIADGHIMVTSMSARFRAVAGLRRCRARSAKGSQNI
jgi:enoyl-CoA hydratase